MTRNGLTAVMVLNLSLGIALGACSDRGASSGDCLPGSALCECAEDACEVGLACVSGYCIETGSDPGGFDQLQLTINKDVDILFVIDNSGSMGEEQAILANNFSSFIGVLEADGVRANYRVGVTTSDNGNPWCPSGTTTPEAGNLVMSSCKDRISDFVFNAGETDASDIACNDICNLDAAALQVQPTTTDVDPTASPRPWLQNIEGKKNIPETTDMAEAFKCIGPQGINGCGFESQLESMYLALIRAQDGNEASYGFLRSNAILALVFVTDEADCSYNKDWAEIFEQDGQKAFWADPTASFPTSAVCWNAGVDCEGDPSNYSACIAVDKAANGTVVASDADAVLHPMNRYIGLVNGLETAKQELNAEQEVIVALIGGVASDGMPYYANSPDAGFQGSFGIGPGCEAVNPNDPLEPIQAVPPVRLRDLVNEFTPGNMFSICEQDYSTAFEAIGQSIAEQIQPICYTKCVEDTDTSTEIVDPECRVIQDPPGNDNHFDLEECLTDASGYVIEPATNDYTMPADDVDVCYAVLVDDSMVTASVNDDMSDYCSDMNYNLEFAIARRPDHPAIGGTSISASCQLADFPDVQCPGIGG